MSQDFLTVAPDIAPAGSFKDTIETIPDLVDWDSIGLWVEKTLLDIEKADFGKDFTVRTVPKLIDPDPVIGVYGSSEWRRFALGCFLADWACYTQPADRADFSRLLSVIAAFPQGFRLYFATTKEGKSLPVGYTGWYPITKDIFNVLHDNPEQITHRGFMVPLRELKKEDNYIYIFNYSIIPQLYKTMQSSMLIKSFASAMRAMPAKGYGAVTVSDDGIRIAEKFGMKLRGNITHDGETEGAYCIRL